MLGAPGRYWEGEDPATAEIKYLEWVAGMGLRHASVLGRSLRPAADRAASSPGGDRLRSVRLASAATLPDGPIPASAELSLIGVTL